MSTYKRLHGKSIKSYTSDPDNAVAGQMWYNSTSQTLKGIVASSAWSSGSPLATARYGSVGAGGTQNAALVSAGTQAPSYTGYNTTEEYNGSGWTAGGNFPASGGGNRGCGTLTAALGLTTSVTNYYNGTAWTAQPSGHNLPTTKSGIGLCGTQTAALAFGGYVPGPNSRTNATEEYDGEGWTSSNTMPASVSAPQGFGIQTAAVSAGGDLGPANTTANAEYNGTSWTAATAVPVAIKDGFSCGTQTAGMLASGAGPSPADVVSTNFLSYDGTSWATIPSMATSRRDNIGGSNGAPNTSTVQAGGNNPPTTSIANTEEFNVATTITTPATWSSGGNLNAARFKMEMNGTQTATIAMGGGTMPSPPSSTTNSEYYDGSSWTAQPAMNNSRQRGGAGAFGTQTAAMSVSGVRNPPAPSNTVTDTEEWNGSNWTSGGAVPSGRYSACFFGTQTAGVFAGGNPGPSNTGATDSAEYNGSSFSTGNAMANGRYNATSGGTLTAGLVVMGTAGGSDTANCEEYDGTNYSAGGTSVIADSDLGGSGTQTNFSAFIGPTARTLIYDGTSWRTDVTGATALGNVAGTGTSSTTGIVASGNPGTGTTLEYNVGTTTANVKTFTTS